MIRWLTSFFKKKEVKEQIQEPDFHISYTMDEFDRPSVKIICNKKYEDRLIKLLLLINSGVLESATIDNISDSAKKTYTLVKNEFKKSKRPVIEPLMAFQGRVMNGKQ